MDGFGDDVTLPMPSDNQITSLQGGPVTQYTTAVAAVCAAGEVESGNYSHVTEDNNLVSGDIGVLDGEHSTTLEQCETVLSSLPNAPVDDEFNERGDADSSHVAESIHPSDEINCVNANSAAAIGNCNRGFRDIDL